MNKKIKILIIILPIIIIAVIIGLIIYTNSQPNTGVGNKPISPVNSSTHKETFPATDKTTIFYLTVGEHQYHVRCGTAVDANNNVSIDDDKSKNMLLDIFLKDNPTYTNFSDCIPVKAIEVKYNGYVEHIYGYSDGVIFGGYFDNYRLYINEIYESKDVTDTFIPQWKSENMHKAVIQIDNINNPDLTLVSIANYEDSNSIEINKPLDASCSKNMLNYIDIDTLHAGDTIDFNFIGQYEELETGIKLRIEEVIK